MQWTIKIGGRKYVDRGQSKENQFFACKLGLGWPHVDLMEPSLEFPMCLQLSFIDKYGRPFVTNSLNRDIDRHKQQEDGQTQTDPFLSIVAFLVSYY